MVLRPVLLLWFLAASSPEQIWKDAVGLHQSGRLEEAAGKYSELLGLRADYVPALSNLGSVYLRLGRFEDAAAQFRRASTLQPEHFGIRLNLALALYNQSRLPDAIPELEKLHAQQPANEQVTLLLGDCLLRMGENRRVIDLLASREGSDNRAVAYLLGSALIRDSQITRGQRIMDRLFRDGSAEGLMLLGAAQIAAQENKKALATLEQALAANSKLPELHSLYGKAKLTDGDPAGAKDAFLQEIALNPTDFEANLQLGALCRIEKDFEKAAEYLGRAEKMRPHSLALKYQLANLRLSTGAVAEAIAMLEEVTRDAPGFVEGHITLATAYYRAKRKVDGDRERSIVDKLNADQQQKESTR